MPNDTAIYDAMAYNPSTVQHDEWVAQGTLEAIHKRGLKPDLATLRYCPKGWLIDGFRPKNVCHDPLRLTGAESNHTLSTGQ